MARFLRRHDAATRGSRPAGESMRYAAADRARRDGTERDGTRRDGTRRDRTPPGRRIAAAGIVAVVGIGLHTNVSAVAQQLSAPAGRVAAGSAQVAAGYSQVAAGYSQVAAIADPVPGKHPAIGISISTGTAGRAASQASAFHQIILPDLLIVAPKGLTPQQIARLKKITGVRNMITFDGARITAGGKNVNVIGVNPSTFRSWVPLRTASDQPFWTELGSGDFVAAATTGSRLGLKPGDYYRLTGASNQIVKYGMAAQLGLSGIDLLVNQQMSAKLGLVRQVAGLISAPGVSVATLTSKVKSVLGPSGKIEVLRGQLPVASVPAGTQPSGYLELFKASADRYCPGLSWTVLAAIGQIESGDGANVGPSSAGALGPMQFLPQTWAVWGIDAFGQTGQPDVMNPYDAVPSAARLLCADGAAAGGRSLYNAIFDYNHADWYVNEVLSLAAEYAADYR